MPKNQKNVFYSDIVGFKPAELRIGVDWLIVYYARNPLTGLLERFRNRVPKIANKKERTKYAQKMIYNLNEKLYAGWSPFEEMGDVSLKQIKDCVEMYLKTIEKETKDGVKRDSSLRTIQTFIRLFLKFINEKYKQAVFISQIDIRVINHFLDDVYLKKNTSVHTYNSYLMRLRAFFNFCISKGFISKNPAEGIKSKRVTEKTRVVLNDKEKERLARLRYDDFHLYVLCMTTYYCFIRPKELLMLKVGDVNLEKGYITIPAEVAKNRKTESVTIPNLFLPDLQAHIGKATADCYLFGWKWQANTKKATRLDYHWDKIKEKYNFRKEVQFYSLKDTGITDMLNAGVPAIKVRDQARHSDLKITEVYTTRNKFADEVVKNIQY